MTALSIVTLRLVASPPAQALETKTYSIDDKVMENPPELITCDATSARKYIKHSDLKEYLAVVNYQVNPVFSSYDSKLVAFNWEIAHIKGVNTTGNTVDTAADQPGNHAFSYSVSFSSNADEIVIPATGTAVRVSVDEHDGKGYQLTSYEGTRTVEAGGGLSSKGNAENVWTSHIVRFAEAKERNYKVELQGKLRGIYIGAESPNDPNYELKPVQDDTERKKIMFIGDSQGFEFQYTLPFLSYPTVVANNLGMDCINAGIGGSGYTKMGTNPLSNYQERAEYTLGGGDDSILDPDIVVLCGGGNDVTSAKKKEKTIDDIAAAADSCYKKIKEMKPNAKIIVYGVEYANSPSYNVSKRMLEETNDKLKEKAKNNKCCYIDCLSGDAIDESGKIVVSGDGPIVYNADDVCPDKIHCTVAGYKSMGNKLSELIGALL